MASHSSTSTSTTSSPSPSPLSTSSSNITPSSYFTSIVRRRQQKKMSITQTYYLAHTARKKLTREASRADHDLRLLVGHANLLDSLMLELADAEREQERWFNQTVSGVTKTSSQGSESRHIQWAETVVEDPEEDWDPEDLSDADSDVSDSDSDYDEDEYEDESHIYTPVRRRAPSPVAIITEKEVEEDYDSDSDSDFEYDDAEDLEELTLTRSPSRQTPPDLLSDSDGESEDDTMPPSPPQPTLETFNEKEPQTTEIPLSPTDLDNGYYVPGQARSTIIEAY
ncbi:hypothetical protein CBS63078_9477 [Aspergillus niger]|uniref:Contig An16c0220, genomic contig n=5 Tax=Aspergillus TaxID=5052 RepID=A2R8E9_ASPNC|nr:uncharacterized protein An16g06890 [Aspergillus niger]XP_025459369.1 uncharacterized protein BO96DRAFT_95265 [Aspergillus niger CBS 101883]XP_026623202.1 hypothetical protein BDQ94DRAFT_76840 [Aspergillus welwitschiae]RDH21485.1 hypothetical protein M747DRAFT_294789 [Aspergillus niger ATCC 13496]RDK44359.1 hypothetical protein M752DRAFT_139144 [Aspergillus phoenicis ATCC 13157]KAI2817113.1 hypothetical protein CBS115989_6268 [Aspergillus niger]KAI2826070.1 hypothetical protein CBS133816_78|eukprot:XP_001397991.1 hypothetical protein ANI_1_926144 [Aspergillus niger CBS 513.88]